MTLMRRLVVFAALVVLVTACGRMGLDVPGADDDDDASPAPGSTPPPGLEPGPGADGDLDVPENGGGPGPPDNEVVVNICKEVISVSSTRVVVNNINGLDDGDRYVVVQMQSPVVPASGDTAPIQSPQPVGTWQVFYGGNVVDEGQGGDEYIEISDPLKYDYVSNQNGGSEWRAQVCTFPDFNNVTVPEPSSILAPQWNGDTGGIVAFTVAGTIDLQGTIDATGRGFRGGDSGDNSSGRRGEGIDPTWYNSIANDNGGNGGGGGPDTNDGGGGGGHAGAGGYGAHQSENAGDPRGELGARLVTTGYQLIYLGGGGGSGSENTGGFQQPSQDGGDGGGIILIGANDFVGGSDSVIEADGQRGQHEFNSNDAGSDGGGGGGAGGTIILYSKTVTFDGEISAAGGNGANVEGGNGPGGGGGGGRVLGYGAFDVSGADVSGGTYGEEGGDQNPLQEATNGEDGLIENYVP